MQCLSIGMSAFTGFLSPCLYLEISSSPVLVASGTCNNFGTCVIFIIIFNFLYEYHCRYLNLLVKAVCVCVCVCVCNACV